MATNFKPWVGQIVGATLAAAFWVAPSYAADALIQGQISHNGRPAVGAIVTVCEEKSKPTNGYGNFMMSTDVSGKCRLSVSWKDKESDKIDVSRAQRNFNIELLSWENQWVIESR